MSDVLLKRLVVPASRKTKKPRTASANAAINPTRSCDHFALLETGISLVLHKLSHVRILGRPQFRLRSVEYQTPFMHHEEFCFHSSRRLAPVCRLDLTAFRIVAEI